MEPMTEKIRAKLDEADTRLLAALQRNAQLTAQELGALLNLSPSQAGRRRLRLETAEVIRGYVARLLPEAVGLDVQAFLQVHLSVHGPVQSRDFAQMASARPEITSAWTLTVDADYLLHVFCADLPALNRLIHEVLLPHPAVARVHSQIVMSQLKVDGPLPT